MIVSHVEFAVRDSLPVPRYPPVIAVFASVLCCMISPGDMVRVSPNDAEIILGRVIDVKANRGIVLQSLIPVHQDAALADDRAAPLIKLQLILAKNQSECIYPDAIWPIQDEETLMATRGILQVAHTNCVVWISPEQVIDLIVVLHSHDCIHHTFGSICGRENAFFTCANAVFDHANDQSTSHEFQLVKRRHYFAFGLSTNSLNPSMVTETEKEVEMKYSIHRHVHKLLTKVGKIGGTATYTGAFSKAEWCHLIRCLVGLDESLRPPPSAVQCKKISQAILHGNLSLETKKVPTTRTSITIRTPSQFAALRRCFSSSIGVGVKKRPPNNTDINEGRSTFDLQQADIVNMVDVNLEGLEDDAENNDWFPEDATQLHQYFHNQRNYVRLRYDFRLREIRITIKAMAINIGKCDAEPVMNFLASNNIPWGHDHGDDDCVQVNDDLRPRRGVVIENEMWMISHVNIRLNSVVLVRPDLELGKTITVSLAEAREGLLPG